MADRLPPGVDPVWLNRMLQSKKLAADIQAQEAKRKEESETRSMQMQGQNEYQQMISAGVPHAEAIRRAGAKLYYGNPEKLMETLTSLQPPPPQPLPMETNYHGQPYLLRTDRFGQQIPVRVPPATTGSNPQNQLLMENMRELRRDISSRERAAAGVGQMLPASEATNAVPQLRQQLQQMEQQLGQPPVPTQGTSTGRFSEGQIVRSKRDGRLYKIVNGQPVPAE